MSNLQKTIANQIEYNYLYTSINENKFAYIKKNNIIKKLSLKWEQNVKKCKIIKSKKKMKNINFVFNIFHI